MGDLFDELQREKVTKRKTQLDAVIEALSPDDLKDFLLLLEDESVPAAALCRVMVRRGHKLNRHAVLDYRHGTFRYEIGKTK